MKETESKEPHPSKSPGTLRAPQIEDVSWRESIKYHLREHWSLWMREGEKSYTKLGRMKSYVINREKSLPAIIEFIARVTSREIKSNLFTILIIINHIQL